MKLCGGFIFANTQAQLFSFLSRALLLICSTLTKEIKDMCLNPQVAKSADCYIHLIRKSLALHSE